MEYILSPSILAANFAALGDQILECQANGAQYLHVDVMDGDFVPSISFGMPVITSIRKITDLFFDVHLMVRNPERYLSEFAECGADGITIHAEATEDVRGALLKIKELGKRVGLSINPDTPVSQVVSYLDLVDMILIMTVNPGFGGQKYIESSTDKIKELKGILTQRGLSIDIEVDGGITKDNIDTVLDAGANVIVMGSSVFGGDIAANTSYFCDVLGRR